jgi:ketosteroid isomerase-like protein
MKKLKGTINQFLDAFSHLQLENMMEFFSEEATAFFPVQHHHLRLNGKDAITTAFAKVITGIKSSGNMSIRLETEDMKIQFNNAYAIVTFHIRDSSLSRRTFLFHKTEGKWKIEHLHASNAQLFKTGEV